MEVGETDFRIFFIAVTPVTMVHSKRFSNAGYGSLVVLYGENSCVQQYGESRTAHTSNVPFVMALFFLYGESRTSTYKLLP